MQEFLLPSFQFLSSSSPLEWEREKRDPGNKVAVLITSNQLYWGRGFQSSALKSENLFSGSFTHSQASYYLLSFTSLAMFAQGLWWRVHYTWISMSGKSFFNKFFFTFSSFCCRVLTGMLLIWKNWRKIGNFWCSHLYLLVFCLQIIVVCSAHWFMFPTELVIFSTSQERWTTFSLEPSITTISGTWNV